MVLNMCWLCVFRGLVVGCGGFMWWIILFSLELEKFCICVWLDVVC